jgi:hypothetical protein
MLYIGPVLISSDDDFAVGINYAYVGNVPLTIAVNSPTVGPLPPSNSYVGNVPLTIGVSSPTQGPPPPVSPSALVRGFDPATADLAASITNLVIEDDYDLERAIPGVPSGATLVEAWLTIKEKENDLDADAILQKIITASALANTGQILDTGAGGTGRVLFQLTAAETNTLNAGQVYAFDVQVKTDTGKYSTRIKGWLIPIGQVTDSL